jgi:hypothetical protein
MDSRTTEDKGRYWFALIGGIILFLSGIAVLIKNFFITKEVNGYEILFGLEFIAAGYYFSNREFKGFKKI